MSQEGSHRGRTTSWAAVVLMVVGAITVGVALLVPSWLVFWIGLGIGIVGVITAVAGGLMSDNPALPGEPGYVARH